MYFNPKFGNFGMLALPLGLFAFFAGLYTALYGLFTFSNMLLVRGFDFWKTGIPPHLPTLGNFQWFYINTSSLTLLIVTAFLFMIVSIGLGQRIANTRLGFKAFASYFMLFGFVAPLWLARAVWGTMRSREATWR